MTAKPSENGEPSGIVENDRFPVLSMHPNLWRMLIIARLFEQEPTSSVTTELGMLSARGFRTAIDLRMILAGPDICYSHMRILP